MYIKTKSGDYINSKSISGLRIKCCGDFNVVAECIDYGGGVLLHDGGAGFYQS